MTEEKAETSSGEVAALTGDEVNTLLEELEYASDEVRQEKYEILATRGAKLALGRIRGHLDQWGWVMRQQVSPVLAYLANHVWPAESGEEYIEKQRQSTVKTLVRLTRDGDYDVRESAYRHLASCDADQFSGVVKKGLGDDNYRARRIVLEEIGKLGLVSCLGQVKRFLSDGDSDVRGAAFMALIALSEGDDKLAPVYDKLESSDWVDRRMAARVLKELGTEADCARLEPLLEDSDYDVRVATFEAMLSLTSDKGVLARQMACNHSSEVTRLAWKVLGQELEADVLLAFIDESFVSLKTTACSDVLELLQTHHESELPRFAKLIPEVEEGTARYGLGQWMVHQEVEGKEELFRALLAGDVEWVREVGLTGLRELDVSDLLDCAKSAIDSDSDSTRRVAVEILCREPDASLLPLLEPLVEDDDDEVKRIAMEALLKLDPSRTMDWVRPMCESDSWSTRQSAMELLKDYGQPEAMTLIQDCVTDDDCDVRRSAMEAAFVCDPNNKTKWMVDVFDYAGWDVRRDMMNSIRDNEVFSPDIFQAVLTRFEDEDCDVVESAVEAALAIAPDRLGEMFERLDDMDEDNTENALHHLGEALLEHGSPELVGWMTKLAENEDSDVAIMGTRALCKFAPEGERLRYIVAVSMSSDDASEEALEQLAEWPSKEEVIATLGTIWSGLREGYADELFSLIREWEEEGALPAPVLPDFCNRLAEVEDTSAMASLVDVAKGYEWPERLAMFRGFFADDSAPGEVRRHAYLGLREWLPNEAHALSLQAMASDYSSLRYAALCYFGEQKEQSLREKYESLLSDHDYSMRSKSLEILSELFPEDAVSFAEKLISDDYWLMRQKAAQIFGEHGTAEHLPKLEVLLQDSDSDVRREAFKAAVSLGPERKLRLALGQIGSYDHETKTLAEEIVADVNDPQLLTEAAVQALQDINNQSETAKKLFAMLADDAPDKIPDVLGLLHKMESDYDAQEFFKRCLNEDVPLPVEQLESIMEQNDSDSVRRQAFEKLCELRPGDRLVLIVKALEDNSWEMRQHALRLIQEEDEPDPALVDDLLPMCRDQDYDVRQAALHTIARFNDIRAFGEIVASLQDENDTVRELAQALLSGEHGNLPVMKRFARFNQKSKVPVWEKMREQVAEVNEWASKIGYELLGKTVFVTQPGLKGAEDEPESARKSIVEIELPETPITHFYDDGQEVMKALALYKLGHYLCNEGTRGYKTMCGIAKSEGIRELYDLLTHERIERNLRSRRDEWGPLLDRLTSYAFSKTIYRVPIEQYAQLVDEPDEVVLEQIRSGALPGQLLPVSRARPRQVVSLRDRDMIKIPNALPPLIAFLWCLRCGYDAALHPNPVVAEALALIPSNLRTMKHAEVLQVARDISALLGACEQHKQQFQELMDKLQGKKKQQGQQGQQGACSGGQPGEGQPGGAGQPGGMGSPGMGQRLRKSGGMGSMMERHLQRLREMGMSPNWMSPPDSAPRTGKHSRRVRKQRQVIYRRMPSSGRKLPGGQAINLGNELGFDLLPNERSLPVDPQAHAQLVGPIRKHIRRLRSYFERLGRSTQDEYASRRGARLDVSQARRLIYTNTPNLLVHSHEEIMADMYLGILIDRSGSMDGEKIRVAKSFGSLVLESARSIRGIEGHINAFDDDTFIYLGNFQRSSVSSLEAGGGNNDAGGLHRAAQLALHSRKKNKLLVMISDGAPTECTFEALKGFVARLEREYNIRCAQVAVESLDQIAFPHYVDLSAYSLDEAVGHFGKLLIRLTSSWR